MLVIQLDCGPTVPWVGFVLEKLFNDPETLAIN
jgi:hypothetical protein